jgi:hypothetical protein
VIWVRIYVVIVAVAAPVGIIRSSLFYFILFVCVCYYNAAEQVFDVFDRYCVGSDLKIGLAIGQTISSRTKGVGGWR